MSQAARIMLRKPCRHTARSRAAGSHCAELFRATPGAGPATTRCLRFAPTLKTIISTTNTVHPCRIQGPDRQWTKRTSYSQSHCPLPSFSGGRCWSNSRVRNKPKPNSSALKMPQDATPTRLASPRYLRPVRPHNRRPRRSRVSATTCWWRAAGSPSKPMPIAARST